MLQIPEIPGGDGFTDVTALFQAASHEMDVEELALTDGFELQDAMTAVEIGEPRMDSGSLGPSSLLAPSFDPMTPLLPLEVCWLLDRSFACEIEWHSGSTLSQSVYTFLYVHRLADLSPELQSTSTSEPSSERPKELLTLVLRAGVIGLLKSCDAAWRELNKGRVLDGEDWQGEKCDIPLLEGYPFASALQLLESAMLWVAQASEMPTGVRAALTIRLGFRKAILQLFLISPFETREFESQLSTAKQLLKLLKEDEILDPPADSPAQAALDPHVLRNLHAFVPLTPRTLRPQKDIWNIMTEWIDHWSEIACLALKDSVTTWEAVGMLHAWARQYPASAFFRSLTRSTFDSDVLVLGHHPPQWLADSYLGVLGLSSGLLNKVILDASASHQRSSYNTYDRSAAAFAPPPGRGLQSSTKPSPETFMFSMIKLLTKHHKMAWMNPSRRRRALSKGLIDWFNFRNALNDLANYVSQQLRHAIRHDALVALPRLAEHTLYMSLREVLLSGFKLELYDASERPAAYWLLTQICLLHCTSIENLLPAASSGIDKEEIQWQHSFSQAIKVLSDGLFMLLLSATEPNNDWTAQRPIFERRHKWIISLPAKNSTRIPDFASFVAEATYLRRQPRDGLALIRCGVNFLDLLARSPNHGATSRWASGRDQFISSLASTTVQTGDASQWIWDVTINPWFPIPIPS